MMDKLKKLVEIRCLHDFKEVYKVLRYKQRLTPEGTI
jgi:hypothetical protein